MVSRRSMPRILATSVFCSLVLVLGCARKPALQNEFVDGDVQLKIVDVDGLRRHIAAQRGRVVVVDCWSTGCPPCMAEFHRLIELAERHKNDAVSCISLSFDYEGIGKPQEQLERVGQFLKSKNSTIDNFLSSVETFQLFKELQVPSLPTVFVYDRAGVLRKRFDNLQSQSKDDVFTYEQVGQLVSQLLSEKDSDSAEGTGD